MRGVLLFLAGLVAGIFLMQPSAAQGDKPRGLKLNHVGLNVKNFDESVDFYTKTMGFREAFTFRDQDGKPTLAYIQISRDTFLELMPANADRPAGMTHIGIQADDVNATVSALRQGGLKIEDARAGRTKAPLTNVTDPNGVRIELLELAPESMQRKAVDGWK